MILVTSSHMRSAGICVNGARQYFAKNNLDFRDFLKKGVDAEILRATADPVAMRAIAEAEKESSDGR